MENTFTFQNFLILRLKLPNIFREIPKARRRLPFRLTGEQSGRRRLLQGHVTPGPRRQIVVLGSPEHEESEVFEGRILSSDKHFGEHNERSRAVIFMDASVLCVSWGTTLRSVSTSL